MALRFIDGFDWCDISQFHTKYLNYSTGTPQGQIVTGRQPPTQPGGGRALDLTNSGFGIQVYTQVFTSQPVWIIGMNLLIDSLSYSSFGGVIFRWESGPTDGSGNNPLTQLTVAINPPGQLAFYSGSGLGRNGNAGALIASTAFNVLKSTYQYLEIKVHFGLGGTIEVHLEDALVLKAIGLNIGQGAHIQDPDRMSILLEHFGVAGYTIDDLYYADGSGVRNNDFLGPCRVTFDLPGSDASIDQWNRNGGTSDFSRINEDVTHTVPCPDGDTTYIEGQAGVIDRFGLNAMPCFGRILGAAANVTGRRSTLAGAALDLLVRPVPGNPLSESLIGGTIALGPSYAGAQGMAEVNPFTANIWTDRDIDGGWWGVRSLTGLARVTSLYIEKLTSLRPVPFDCGSSGASYYSF